MACVYPELLLSSVQEQLQPLVGYLQGLGCSSAQAARLLQVRPGLTVLPQLSHRPAVPAGEQWASSVIPECGLRSQGRQRADGLPVLHLACLCDTNCCTKGQLSPARGGSLLPSWLTSMLRNLGVPLLSSFAPCCLSLRPLPVLQEVPQALSSKPHDIFGSRIAALQQLGVDSETIKSVVGRNTMFLTSKGAPQEQLAFLKEELCFTTEQVSLHISCATMPLSDPYSHRHLPVSCGAGTDITG